MATSILKRWVSVRNRVASANHDEVPATPSQACLGWLGGERHTCLPQNSLCPRLRSATLASVIGRYTLSALLLLVLGGCSTVPGDPPPELVVVSENYVPPAVPPETAITTEPVVKLEPVNVPVSNVAPEIVRMPANTPEPVIFNQPWISLERWSQASGFGMPRKFSPDPLPSYAFASGNGTVAIRVGSQLASWNGLELRLGFAPQLIDGHPYVHTLDVQKNFLPLLQNTLRQRTNMVVVIDPGHGGTDIGTTNVYSGRFEKEYTLDWARRLQGLMLANGWTAWLTRTNDSNLSLPGRVAFAEQHKADIFISLHFNSSFPDRLQAGLETYCLTPAGMPSNLTRGFKDDVSMVYPNNRYDLENFQYAIEFHRALLNVNGRADRGVRRARFLGVLQGQNRPAVLVEGGYLSNPHEARQIADGTYRQQLAEALAHALVESSGTPGTNVLTQSSSDPGRKTN
jgi:N-acetylmuramoyl-L-alanine amidase